MRPSFVGKNLFPSASPLLAQCVLQQVAIQLENAKDRLCIDKITTNTSSKYFYLSNNFASYTVSKYRSSCQLYYFSHVAETRVHHVFQRSFGICQVNTSAHPNSEGKIFQHLILDWFILCKNMLLFLEDVAANDNFRVLSEKVQAHPLSRNSGDASDAADQMHQMSAKKMQNFSRHKNTGDLHR